MKITKYINIAAMMLVFAAITSCSSDFLDAENKSSGGKDDESFFSSNPEAMMYYAFSSLQDITTAVDINVQGTDLYVANRVAATELMRYTMSTTQKESKSLYEKCYGAILYANGAIKYAKAKYGENSETEQQARFIRDYCYYVLTQQFGAVPYITEYVQNSNRSYGRTPLADVYNGIIADLEGIRQKSALVKTMNPSTPGKVSTQAVNALLAKVCLAAGWDLETTANSIENGTYTVNSTEYFKKAESYAKDAIEAMGNAKLDDMSFADVWNQDKEDSNVQAIFSVQFDKASYPGDISEGGHSLQNNFGGYYGATKASACKNAGSANSQSVKSMYLWEKGDKRFDVTYMTTVYNASKVGGTATWGTEGYYGYYNNPDPEKNLNIFIKYFPWYTDLDEAKQYLKDNAARFQDAGQANLKPRAFVLTAPNVTVLTVNASGVVSTSTQDMETFNLRNDGGCISVKKFDDKTSDQIDSKNDYRDVVVMSLSEMYLVRAEARLMQDKKGDFFDDLNVVRQRAGLAKINSVADYKAPYLALDEFAGLTLTELDLLLDENAREFYAEGHRFVDLRRTKQLVKYNVLFNKYINGKASNMANSKGEYKLYRPIDQSIIDKNDGLTADDQNLGY